MHRLELTIDGMSCDHCVRAVRSALEAIPGVEAGEVRVGAAQVRYQDPAVVRDIVAALEEEGYQVTGQREAD